MRKAYLMLLGVLLAGCTTIANHNETTCPQIIAHRGASAYAPENTLAAFERAIALEADWFELDCTFTQDDAVIVLHDNTLDRTTTGAGPVAEQTLAQLKTLDAGSWFSPDFTGERLPTLEEALACARDRIGVYIEIKAIPGDTAPMDQLYNLLLPAEEFTPELRQQAMNLLEASGSRDLALTRAVINLVRQQGMEKQVVVQSFSPVVCLTSLCEAPELRTEFLGSFDGKHPEAWERFIQFGEAIDVAGFNVSNPSLSPARLADYHRRSKTVAVWTVDKPEDMQRFVSWGVDALITNKPDVARKTIAQP